MATKLVFEAERTGYSIKQVRWTMTVGELMDFLSQFDEDTPIYTSHDRGYTYGGFLERNFEEVDDDDEEDE